MQNHWLFSSDNIYFIFKCQKADEKKSKEDKQTLEELNSAHHRSQAKRQSIQTSYIKQFNISCFHHVINILLTELSRSVWENLDLGCVYRSHCVQSLFMTLVKILPYRPPARLIRAKYCFKGLVRKQTGNKWCRISKRHPTTQLKYHKICCKWWAYFYNNPVAFHYWFCCTSH